MRTFTWKRAEEDKQHQSQTFLMSFYWKRSFSWEFLLEENLHMRIFTGRETSHENFYWEKSFLSRIFAWREAAGSPAHVCHLCRGGLSSLPIVFEPLVAIGTAFGTSIVLVTSSDILMRFFTGREASHENFYWKRSFSWEFYWERSFLSRIFAWKEANMAQCTRFASMCVPLMQRWSIWSAHCFWAISSHRNTF